VNDIQDLLLSKPSECHYHAVNVLYNIKKHDFMSFIKVGSASHSDHPAAHHEELELQHAHHHPTH
jgi:hypothetical protein